MSRSFIRTGIVAVAALVVLAAFDSAGQQIAAGAWGSAARAADYKGERKARIRARRRARQSGSTAEEIARYFQLYGGFIDPAINKQSQGGPFDSGFFFDSGIGPNGGDSPYMN